MILDREIYFPFPFHKRVYLFIKEFFYILVRFLGRPTWGRPKAGVKLNIEKQDLVLLVDEEGKLRCKTCRSCVEICPTQCLELSSRAEKETPQSFNFKPLDCMYCSLCEEVCPESAIAMISSSNTSGSYDQTWIRDLNYLGFREELNEGKGLSLEELKELRK